jgi:hypothetical protein
VAHSGLETGNRVVKGRTQFAQVSGSDLASGGGFGASIVFRKGTVLVGTPLQHPQPNNVPYPEGEAYIYTVNYAQDRTEH